MEKRKIPLKNLLRDRGFIDQWGFMFFAVVGFAGIVSAKWFNIETSWVAIGAIVAMLLYALLIGFAGTGKMRADQSGDNCYYLGLIYTLASLSYAIGTFDPNNTASTIVQGFGIALATTIFGLILRVFFSQGRPDLENVEDEARLELVEAVSDLKSQLGEAVRHMNDFTRQIQQSMVEMHDTAAKNIEEFTQTSAAGLQTVVQDASEAIRAEANDFAARSKKYDTAFNKVLSKLDGHSDGLERISASHEALQTAADRTKGHVEAATASLATFSQATNEASNTVNSVDQVTRSAKDMMEQMASLVSLVDTTLQKVAVETDQQLEKLRLGPGDVVNLAMSKLREASEALEAQTEKIGALHQTVLDDITGQASSTAETSRKHNEQLENELKRSRDLANQVHQSFVEMTGNLAQQFEGSR